MGILKFKVNAVRTIKSPSDPDITTYYTWVNFNDLPKDISLEVNPRKPKMNTAVAKQLINAVKREDSLFEVNNRGIVITAKSVKFNTGDSTLELDLDNDESKYGILDGGHTYTAIIENRNPELEKFVKLEIVVGEKIDVSALADARNTSAQVSDIALFELDDKFDFIKNAIQNEAYANDIAYKDNENKRIPVVEILKLLFAFNIKKFPNDENAPVSSYSGKAAVFKDFKNEFETNEKNNNSQKENIYYKLSPLIPTFVDLYETIQKELPSMYQTYKKQDVKSPKFGLVKGVDGFENSSKFQSLFNQITLDYDIPLGFILPIFGAFRALLHENDDSKQIEWLFDPIEIWQASGTRLAQNTFDTDGNPQLAGKNKTLWQANYRIVDGIRKDKLIEMLYKK